MIRIEWMEDWSDCETCGGGMADGARVYIDNTLVIDMEPVAHCYDSVTYARCTVYEALFKHLGLLPQLQQAVTTLTDDVQDTDAWYRALLETNGYTVEEVELPCTAEDDLDSMDD